VGASCQPMLLCDHEEADSRMCVHVQDALRKGMKTICVRTVDTDVIVILVGVFLQLKTLQPDIELWVAFGMGKHFTYYHINTIYHHLGQSKATALPLYHAYTGCDTNSQFFGKGKKSTWEAWHSYPDVTEAFPFVANHPFVPLTINSPVFNLLQRYTCVLYDKTSLLHNVNELRQDVFSQKTNSMDKIPPTQV
jgi:hypothetical protein